MILRCAGVFITMLLLRKATQSDLPRIADIEFKCFGEQSYPIELFKEFIKYGLKHFYVAELNGEVVGYIIAVKEFDEAHVISIAVDPKHQRKGIGKTLIQKVISDFKDGVRLLRLEVSVRNREAINFYLKMGFKVDGLIPNYYGRGLHAYSMTLSLW